LEGDIGDFAMVMANSFNSNQILDVTPTDVVAGLVMIRRVQRQDLLETRERLQKEISRENSPPTIDPQEGNTRDDIISQMSTIGESALDIIPGRQALLSRHPRELYLAAEGVRFMPMAQAMYT
jgi:hypothetical protein